MTNTIDGFGRVAYKTLTVGSNSFTHYLNFMHLSETRTSNEVARLYYRKGEDEQLTVLDYKYDVNGNITEIYDRPFTSNLPTDSDTPTVSYEYDQLNQITHEVNGYTGETVDYTYDKRGNILSKTITKDGETNTINYTYGDSNWKDKLTAYDGKTITYDEIGNPLTYDGWTFDWQKGRQLASMSNSDTTLSFKYNDSGIRTSKTVDGVETKYLLDGSTIVAQKTGDTILWFYYDGAGQLTAMQNGSNGEYYYYVYNHQGDVVALLDSSLNYVANYTYDSWGKVISVTGSNTAIGNLNPFRYRGYYYDDETGLYYLNSRYYNPEMGRFINADDILCLGNSGNILAYNLFSYCENNLVNQIDPTGNGPFSVRLGLFDLKFIHDRVVKMISESLYSNKISAYQHREVYVKGSKGNGRLDVYDEFEHQYYEVKSLKSANKQQTIKQMEKYDVSEIYSSKLTYRRVGAISRGTKAFSGSFEYGIWDINYYLYKPGLIVYTYEKNSYRSQEAVKVAVTGAVFIETAFLAVASGGTASLAYGLLAAA